METVLECSCCLLGCASSLSCSPLGNEGYMKAMVRCVFFFFKQYHCVVWFQCKSYSFLQLCFYILMALQDCGT